MKKQLTFNDIRKKFEELIKKNPIEDVLRMGIFIEVNDNPRVALECNVMVDSDGRSILIR